MQRSAGRPEVLCASAKECFDGERAVIYGSDAGLQKRQAALTSQTLDLLLGHAAAPAVGDSETPRGPSFRLVLDLGCGGGFSCATVQARLPAACVVGLDVSLDMLRSSGEGEAGPSRRWLPVCASMASLPFARPVFDAVVSVSALQWLTEAAELCSFFRGRAPGK